MQRLIRLSILIVLLGILSYVGSIAQTPPKPQVFVSGRIAQEDVRLFLKDSIYVINRDYVVAGTLIIEPGTKIMFHPSGRIIDSVGGRIIADGKASATYNPAPDGINPITAYEPYGYASLDYFLDRRNINTSNVNKTINVATANELTVHNNKRNYIFHVVLDTQARKIVNLVNPSDSKFQLTRNTVVGDNNNRIIVTFEQALMFVAGRMNFNPQNFDPNLKLFPWTRVGNQSPNIVPNKITFVGSRINLSSKEWGHIIVLPGARAAFFRDVVFDNFKKDTTVDRANLYTATGSNWSAVNKKMNNLTNGAGGVITTFSSRTWLINASFTNNMARHRGGALNILQSPNELAFTASGADLSAIGTYAANKNPKITNRDKSSSSINSSFPIPKLDNIDEGSAVAEPWGMNNDNYRQAFDDGRLAVYLGRMRNLTFTDNKVILADYAELPYGDVTIIDDDLTNPAVYPHSTGNHAFGGAIYISGDESGKNRQIEIGFGVNDSLLINNTVVSLGFDKFIANNNTAENRQNSINTEGARGGAIYVAKYTSLILAGDFKNNKAYCEYFDNDKNFGLQSSLYSLGGAVFAENQSARLQIRGGNDRGLVANNNATRFENNTAGAGGAIFVDGNASTMLSPIIGGSDSYYQSRDYGFDIQFKNNHALTFGGAVLTKRNTLINGAGGFDPMAVEPANLRDLYSDIYFILFENNTAGFSGGAIDIRIPSAYPAIGQNQRAVHIIRTKFQENTVGENVSGDAITEIRGGGAIYSVNADLSLMKAVEFIRNTAKNGNGGAIASVLPNPTAKRYYLTDVDHADWNATTYYNNVYHSKDDIFNGINQDKFTTRMLTKFIENKVTADPEVLNKWNGSGTTQVGKGTLPTTLRIYGTKWIDNNTGFAVGYDGLMIKLTNGGKNWEYVATPSPYRYRDIEFPTPTVGYAAGDRGMIVKTMNGGSSWTMLNTGTTAEIMDVYFFSSNIGWAATADGMILKTTDGGSSWMQQLDSKLNISLNSIYFTSSDQGYAVGNNGNIWYTTNGVNWNKRPVNGLSTKLNEVYFKNASSGYALGDGGIMVYTTNAGATWDFMNLGKTSSLYGMYFYGQNTGFIVGSGGLLMQTLDAGATWTAIDAKTGYSIYDIYFSSANTGYLVGDAGLIKKTVDAGATWTLVEPTNLAYQDVVRRNKDTYLPENGVGLGGAIYILDSVSVDHWKDRNDSTFFNRVRFQNNEAVTGSAIYSDNFDLKLIFNRSLVTGNVAYSTVGYEQNVITGPLKELTGGAIRNEASSDLVATTIYGEIQGPIPSFQFSEAANSMYNNSARFLIRLPDAPNSKGVLAGSTGLGFGGTDTLRGNYWGVTESNVNFSLPTISGDPNSTDIETFFVNGDGKSWIKFLYPELINSNPADPRLQGPFESLERHDVTYKPILLDNATGDDTAPGTLSIPEKLVFSGHIYDIYDKGTDIKTADYSKRRMSPIEDYAVGIPPYVRVISKAGQPSNGKHIRRWVRNPFDTEALNDDGTLKFPSLAAVQSEFKADKDGNFYHPIGYPLYLEAEINYNNLLKEYSNNDINLLNNSVFFVINLKTGDFVRANLEQVGEVAPTNELFRGVIELVPDSAFRKNPSLRRTAEGLANLPGTAKEILDSLRRNAYKEDDAALKGRRYTVNYLDYDIFRNNLFSNITMPVSQQYGAENLVTYFGGERYRALPVREGDSLLIVSRTALWQANDINEVDDVFKKGMLLRITGSTLPPQFTGDIVTIQTDTIKRLLPSEDNPDVKEVKIITEFLNKVFVTEDREYPGTYSFGRKNIIDVTGIDSNMFYDPRAIIDPKNNTRLDYTYYVDPSTALSKWLLFNKIYADKTEKNGAKGYLQLAGRPINPFVVPGGEDITVFIKNYPPHVRTIDSLRKLPDGVRPTEEEISKWLEIFPSYMGAETYDTENARFLQQDTINVGRNYVTSHTFKIFVVDSIPEFIPDDATEETVFWQNDPAKEYVVYTPTVITCGYTRDGRLRANLTDKLRFQIDINTTDEMEDNSTYVQSIGWDFRYGKTAYGFLNRAVRLHPEDHSKDEVVELDDMEDGTLIQTRPMWMGTEYIHKYGFDNNKDAFMSDFTSLGKLNVRIDGDVARGILIPAPQYNRYLNDDTLFTVVVNDGHGGVATKQYPVFINVQPEITNIEQLPDAYEDFDYNPTLLDSTRMIKVFDPNMEQKHVFELIYTDEVRNTIAIDPCYTEAGTIDLSTLKTTPNWLRINSETGTLYGVPGVNDNTNEALITVVVKDEDGLSTYKVFKMRVYGINHDPDIAYAPMTDCIDPNASWEATIKIKDIDLLRKNPVERLTITIVDAVGKPMNEFTASPAVINGGLTVDESSFVLKKVLPINATGSITVYVIVEDNNKRRDTLALKLNISAATQFTSVVRVTNNKGAFQDLIWGTSDYQDVTTGDGIDQAPIGTLDVSVCEYELPPVPYKDVFDARWNVPSTYGTLRNIFPTAKPGVINIDYRYKAQFQPGGVESGGSPMFPIYITWNKTTIPAITDAQRNPAGSSWYIKDYTSNGNLFRFNMRSPIDYNFGGINLSIVGDSVTLRLDNPQIDGFIIQYDWATDVTEVAPSATATRIANVSPNPVSSNSVITFELLTGSNAKLQVVDNLGNVVVVITEQEFNAGTYKVEWNGTDNSGNALSSGQYTIRLVTDAMISTYPVVIVR